MGPRGRQTTDGPMVHTLEDSDDERHGTDVTIQSQLRKQALMSELSELYEYKTKVCPDDRNIFCGSVAEHLEHHTSLNAIEDWISIHKEAIKASAMQATILGIRGNRTLFEFPAFNPIHRAVQ